MTHPAEQELFAYLDGELDPAGCRRVEEALGVDAELRRLLAIHRRLGERLAARYNPVLGQEVPARLRGLVETHADPAAAVRASAQRRSNWAGAASIAAALVLAVFAGRSLPERPVAPQSLVLLPEGTAVAKRRIAAPPPASRILYGRMRPDRAFDLAVHRPIGGRAHARASG